MLYLLNYVTCGYTTSIPAFMLGCKNVVKIPKVCTVSGAT